MKPQPLALPLQFLFPFPARLCLFLTHCVSPAKGGLVALAQDQGMEERGARKERQADWKHDAASGRVKKQMINRTVENREIGSEAITVWGKEQSSWFEAGEVAGVREEIPCKMVKYFRLSGQLKSAVQSGNRPLGCRRLLGWGCWQPPAPSARRRKEASLRVLPSPVNHQLMPLQETPGPVEGEVPRSFPRTLLLLVNVQKKAAKLLQQWANPP